MHRNSLTETAGRSMHQAVRLTINKAINDNPLMQELTSFAGMSGEIGGIVERIQAFGFTSVPLGPSKKKGAGGSQGGASQAGIGSQSVGAEQFAAGGGGGGSGGGGGGGGQDGEAAEGIALFLGGQRNHPVVIAVDDRRHRPMGLKPGENAQYDDLGQMTLARRDGLYLLSNDNPEEDGGQSKERMVSLRHVEKKKQERQKATGDQSTSGGQGGAGAQAATFAANGGGQQKTQTPDHSNYKHEGETVNTELRVTKKKIEFRNGDQVKASHDKETDKWNFGGKEHHVTSSDKHTVTSQQIGLSGTTVAINGATSVNGNPIATTNMFIPRDAVIAALEQRIAALEARLA
jgi:phage gp45-like